MSNKLKPVWTEDNEGGYIQIQDSETGDFAGYDPTVEQIVELAKSLKLDQLQTDRLIANTDKVHSSLVAAGADELLRYYPRNFGRVGSARVERSAIPHNYLAFGEKAVSAARSVRRHVEQNEGEN